MAVMCNIIRGAYLRGLSPKLPIGGRRIWSDFGQPRRAHSLRQTSFDTGCCACQSSMLHCQGLQVGHFAIQPCVAFRQTHVLWGSIVLIKC